ncbi:MAG: transposase [Thermodesulfobacteriota bacterium]|nr:transposase [Thermodesulfobacteriota bacterium]
MHCRNSTHSVNSATVLINDNSKVHHSYIVKDWLKGHEREIELFFLPSYSPELNPDEYLNCDLKSGVHSGVPARTQKELKQKAISRLRKLQKLPGRVKKYFKHPKIAHAAYVYYLIAGLINASASCEYKFRTNCVNPAVPRMNIFSKNNRQPGYMQTPNRTTLS